MSDLAYSDMGVESLKKLIRKRKLMETKYTQRIWKSEAVAVLQNADAGEPLYTPARLIKIYSNITRPLAGDSSSESSETETTDEEADEPNTIPAIPSPTADIEQWIDSDPIPSTSNQTEEETTTVESAETNQNETETSTQEESMNDSADTQFQIPNSNPFDEIWKILKAHQEKLHVQGNDLKGLTSSTVCLTSKVFDLEHSIENGVGNGSVSLEQIQEMMSQIGPTELEITINERPTVTVANPHKQFKKLLALVSERTNVYMVGPSGSGKTKAAEMVANTIFPGQVKDKLRVISLCRTTSKGDLMGYRDAHGVYHASDLVNMFENGGVFLFDEVDQATDSIMKLVNMAIANGAMGTVDGLKKRHKDFYCLAAANTYGVGGDRMYCGANQLDASTLNRFFFLEWGYDDKLEATLAGVTKPDSTRCKLNAVPTPSQWLHIVRVARENIAKHRIRAVVSPRTTENGIKSIKAGMKLQDMLDGLVYQGMAKDKEKMVFDMDRDCTEFEAVVQETAMETESVAVAEDTSAAF
jgi:MoxR-like ATPase